uniref:Uncharacterized protein n=1 Tax=Setaria viridis TaxID=4556 RepID=A0A4U6T1R4_SETVI|nr:hypothetical protein SEVIR_9G299100v2 [Setaria viridis]
MTSSNPGAMSFVAALMQDVISSLIDIVVLAPEQQSPEDVVATTSSTMATLVAPEPKIEIEEAEVLEVMTTDTTSKPGPWTKLAVVPLSTTDSEAHADPLAAREIVLEDMQLIDDPLLNVDMVAAMIEMHRHIDTYAEVCVIQLHQ